MKTFPMFLKMEGRRVVVMGGGEDACRKVRLIARSDAAIVVHAGEPDAELVALAEDGRVALRGAGVGAADLDGAALAFAASGCPGADAAHVAIANDRRVLVNAVDQPDICDAYTPSIVDRDPLVIAIGTEGAAPVLGQRIRADLERSLEPGLGRFAAALGAMRGLVARHVPKEGRRAFWRRAMERPRALHAQGAEEEALALLKADALGEAAPMEGSVALVGAGPGGVDHLTLRALHRLQDADVILHDRLADPRILDLARRDAERIYVGKTPGDADRPAAWRQDRIDRMIVRLASEGQKVVRLKCGDPGVFGRAVEEMDACKAAGIAVEIVPGITAASVANAQFGTCLTERGRVDALTLATARDASGGVNGELAQDMRPGKHVAIYMGVAEVEALAASFRSLCPDDLLCTVVERAGHDDARKFDCDLAGLVDTVRGNAVRNPAIISIRWPRDHATARMQVAAAE